MADGTAIKPVAKMRVTMPTVEHDAQGLKLLEPIRVLRITVTRDDGRTPSSTAYIDLLPQEGEQLLLNLAAILRPGQPYVFTVEQL